MSYSTRSRCIKWILCFLLLAIFPTGITDEIYIVPEQDVIETKLVAAVPQPISIAFVGDIMLGRQVERIMDAEGAVYPFTYMLDFLKDSDLTVGNFEGVVGETHIPTPMMGFQFSMKKEYLTYLKDIGFDVLSFANNHSLDLGYEALIYTRKICTDIEIICGGRPRTFDALSTSTIRVGSTTIGFLFVENVLSSIDLDAVSSSSIPLLAESEFQIVYIHWGNEYELVHSKVQEDLARSFIDLGYDTVIGHHPHVIQDIEIYNGKPIFYSLGNFIFDQYFSQDVQEGLVLTLRLDTDEALYTVKTISSTSTRSQPVFMSSDASQTLFTRIFESASTTPGVDIGAGTIQAYR